MIAIYAEDIAGKHARPKETAARLERLLNYFGEATLDQINRKTCEQYAADRSVSTAARRELEDLRAAIRYHWQNGYCSSLTPVILPRRSQPRERWLTRNEAARLLWAAWRLREKQFGAVTDRATARHVARFILIGLYTGTRAGAICRASFEPGPDRAWVDLDRGVFHRRSPRQRETNKRQPPVKLPSRLMAHLRRWKRMGTVRGAVIEWNGDTVKRISRAFRTVRAAAGLDSTVTPHVLRHTCATWLAQAGISIWEAGGFLGMSAETFERVYGHHHPDYQAAASEAMAKLPRQKRDRYPATK